MNSPIDNLLNLPEITVEKFALIDGSIYLTIKIINQKAKCYRCQKPSSELHRVKNLLVKDLPAWGQPVYLRIPRQQFYCRHCQKYFTEELNFINSRRQMTKRYEQYIYKQVINSNCEQVARSEQLSTESVESIFKSVSNQLSKKEWSPVERVSIDEVSKRKGHGNFVTVVGDIDQGKLIEVIDSHKVKDIIETLNQQPIEVREQVKEVSVDMWAGFKKVVKEVFPFAVVVIDRFHVMQLVNRRLNKLRRLANVTIKGSRYLLLKNSQDLTQTEQLALAEILNQSPCLKIAYQMKEEFRDIYEKCENVESGLARMTQWLAYAQIFYGKAARTIRSHLPEICNYFISRTTSGVMEGINNKIKLIMRLGYGITNFDNLRSRLLASFS
jgi:transposase